tara:strand:+ start:5694 stop:6119 length:426 start_codon:yes stop_codon:yes gene_type:complete
MNSSFFVPDKVYKKRIAVCKKCDYYFSPTGSCKICGCFMKIKARISQQHCPKYYWKMHDFGYDQTELTKELPQEVKDGVIEVWEHIKTGVAANHESKRKMIELYNIIYGGSYSITTSCGSCLGSAFRGIAKIYKKIEDEDL